MMNLHKFLPKYNKRGLGERQGRSTFQEAVKFHCFNGNKPLHFQTKLQLGKQ